MTAVEKLIISERENLKLTGKKTSNVVLKEKIDNLSEKVKILEDVLMNLTMKLAKDQVRKLSD